MTCLQGMVDAGESLSVTLKREFGEEALNTLEVPNEQRDFIKQHLDQIFKSGTEVSALLSSVRLPKLLIAVAFVIFPCEWFFRGVLRRF